MAKRLVSGESYPWAFEKFTGKAGKFAINRKIKEWINQENYSETNVNYSELSGKFIEKNYSNPPFRTFLDIAGEMRSIKGKRVVLIWNQKGNPIVSEVFLNLVSSAINSDLILTSIDSGSNGNPESCAKVIKQIVNFRPDLIIFQLHEGLDVEENTLISHKNIAYIKSKIRCSIAILCFDIWREYDKKYISYWMQLRPVFLHVDPDSVNRLHSEISHCFLAWPYIQHLKVQPSILKEQELIRIFFSGSIKFQDRRLWLQAINLMCLTANIQFDRQIFSYSNSKERMTEKEYITELRKSLGLISLSRKSDTHCVIPFRAFQALINGVLVLQETCSSQINLGFFYTPYRHFLPFSEPAELQKQLHWISNNPMEARKIGENAMNFHAENYSAERLWKYLFKHLELSKI